MSELISKQAAIDAVMDEFKRIPTNAIRAKIRIEALPPAQPETATVTIGRTKGGVTMWYECDACGEPVDQNDNYCRNCGRKLKHE